jgi:hypothetical protein
MTSGAERLLLSDGCFSPQLDNELKIAPPLSLTLLTEDRELRNARMSRDGHWL